MNEILGPVTKIECFDGDAEHTFLLLTSQISKLTDGIYIHALNQALISELSTLVYPLGQPDRPVEAAAPNN